MKIYNVSSIDLPKEMQFRENWGWEDSFQRYQLDREFQEKSYFTDMDPDELINLVRHMDNFLMERGISYPFLCNYELVCQAFRKLDEKENNYSEPENYY